MIADKVPGIQTLSPQEKLLLANELWDQVEADQSDQPAHAAIIELLDQRFADFQRDPSTAVRWEDFKSRIDGPTVSKKDITFTA